MYVHILLTVTDNCHFFRFAEGGNVRRNDFMIYPHESYVVELVFELATPGKNSAIYRIATTTGFKISWINGLPPPWNLFPVWFALTFDP